ncbi:hypothetical protein [Nocardia amikacinitolerans]|nr:hypothetical protein [Nocardia amikacinitolerans]
MSQRTGRAAGDAPLGHGGAERERSGRAISGTMEPSDSEAMR